MRTKNSWRKDMKNKFSHNLTKNNSFYVYLTYEI